MPTSDNRTFIAYPTLFVLIIILTAGTACSQQSVSEERVRGIMETLSSDDMKGRKAFTPDIDRAAAFIASEFRSAGLQPLPQLNGYLQSFSMNRYATENVTLTLDGKETSAKVSFGFVYNEKEELQVGNAKTVIVGKDEDLPEAFGKYRSVEEPTMVFVDPVHAPVFARYQAFFGNRPSQQMDGEEAKSVWFVLSKPTSDFSVTIKSSKTTLSLANVGGMIPGQRSDEIVLFSAHYDHLGVVEPVDGDSIANGANDNASGVTAVIELARLFSMGEKPVRTLMFVAFTAEEMGGFGSQYFSRSADPDQITAMFNIEMIGKPAVSGPNTAWITGYDRSTFGELLSKSTEGTIYEFYPDPYPDQNLFYRSDNATLARLGVPAHTISTTPIDVDKDYHQVSDELETIDIAHLTNTINAIARAAKGIISGEDTPTRVDRDSIN